LTSSIDTFVAISGGNLGIQWCQYDTVDAFCNKVDGYFPGDPSSGFLGKPLEMSQFLKYLNTSSVREASHIFALYS
jgi:hypothetical protein